MAVVQRAGQRKIGAWDYAALALVFVTGWLGFAAAAFVVGLVAGVLGRAAAAGWALGYVWLGLL